ncbi:MAG: hypothetical protein WCO00_05775 [Rhodospirillaceae bacterium]
MQSDARGLETIFFIVLAIAASLLVAWIASAIIGTALELLVSGSARMRKLALDSRKRASLIPRLKRRRDGLRQLIDQQRDAVNAAQNQRATLIKTLKKIQSSGDELVRVIGNDIIDHRCYTFIVGNRYVLSYLSKGQPHPLLDESWKSGQRVEVWASSLMSARVAVTERYPTTFGYFVDRLEAKAPRADGDDDRTDAAMVA